MTKKTISKNIKFNTLGQIVVFAINFVLFPFIVSHIGKEIYGAYLLVMTFTGYLGVFDFGVGTALIKYVAEFIGKKDHEQAKKIINASFTFYFIIGLISSIILFLLSFYFDYIFKVDIAHKMVMQRLFLVAASASLFIWIGRTFDSVIQGFQRYDVLTIGNMCASVGTAISAYFIFSNGLGMGWFLAVSYFFIILKYVSFYIISQHRFIKVKIVFPYFNKEIFKKIFSFSIFLFLSNIAGLLIFNFDNFVIGAFVSISAVTVYGAGYVFQNGFRMINSLIGSPLFPAGADMEGKNELQQQKELFFKGTKYMTLFFVPMIIITIVFSKIFIKNWVGDSFMESVLPAQVLMFFWIFNNTVEVGSGLLVAKGYVKERFKFDALNAILNVGLSLILVRYFGILGVALGTTIPMVLVYFPLILYLILKVLQISFFDFFNFAIKKNLLVYGVALVLSLLALNFYSPVNTILVVVEMAVVYAIIMLIGFIFALSSQERKEMLSMIKF